MKVKFLLLISFILLGLNYGCKLGSIDADDTYVGYDYYPLNENRFVEYMVYDTFYDGSVTTDTSYFLKEVQTEMFEVGDETWYKVNLYTKTVNQLLYPLQPDSVWSVSNNRRSLIRKENNFDFIRISFPTTKSKIWDGNAKNLYDSVPYTITSEGVGATVNGNTFDRTLTVVESNRNFLYEVNQQSAVYASGVGMVYRNLLKLERNSQPGPLLGQLQYRQRRVMQVVSYGAQ